MLTTMMHFRESVQKRSPLSVVGSALAELVAPTRCSGCDRQGELFCPRCRESLARDFDQAQVCPRCAAPYGALTCTECWDSDFAFEATAALGVLDGPLARAVVLYKDGGERRLAHVLAPALARRCRQRWGDVGNVVTWIPASDKAIARRGFDHAATLARAFARESGIPAACLLTRPSARDQRGLNRHARQATALSSFVCAQVPKHTEVVLIDDVFTTGATLNAASLTLLAAGARSVRAAVVARAW